MSIIISRYTKSCTHRGEIPLERDQKDGDLLVLPGDKKGGEGDDGRPVPEETQTPTSTPSPT
jgi:hypothetical protein